MTPLRLQPTAPRSQVQHTTTEPLRSQTKDKQIIHLVRNIYTKTSFYVFFYLFELILYVSSTSGRVFLGLTSSKQGLIYMCLAQGAGKARTRTLSISRQAFYHIATALPNCGSSTIVECLTRRSRRRWLEAHRRHCTVSLSKTRLHPVVP